MKMSSLGDVVHALPAVTDAAAHGVRFDWVAEEAFASIPARHPAVDRVLPIAWRRWRRELAASRQPMRDFLHGLRERNYDVVVDAQGLVKSAVVTAMARATRRCGFSFTSAREPLAAFVLDHRLDVAVGGHAVDRLRALFAGAFGYPLPEGPPDFGLGGAGMRAPGRRCLLLHGTTWASKHWPTAMWRALATDLIAQGWDVELPWGDADERARAQAIGADLPGATVLESLTLAELAGRMEGAALVVGVDSGLAHLSGAMGVPTLVVYGSTSAARTGVRGPRVESLQSELFCSPCLHRVCRYRGETLRWRGEGVSPACYALLPPERVREEALRLLD
ncbi:MAG: lipopolysaccharide heptosyltransferase I [Pseudomonadales bacterium]